MTTTRRANPRPVVASGYCRSIENGIVTGISTVSFLFGAPGKYVSQALLQKPCFVLSILFWIVGRELRSGDKSEEARGECCGNKKEKESSKTLRIFEVLQMSETPVSTEAKAWSVLIAALRHLI